MRCAKHSYEDILEDGAGVGWLKLLALCFSKRSNVGSGFREGRIRFPDIS